MDEEVTPAPIRKILVANRGEIAVRIIRACREMGISTVALFSEADRCAPHLYLADEAVAIGPAPAVDSYLRMDRILDAAAETGADAIHPGYGFLSENGSFAEAVRAAGIHFIGPSAQAMRTMGEKMAARAAAAAAGVPVVPGYQESQEEDALVKAGQEIGFPVLVKAAAGGGGKGMRLVTDLDALPAALEAARREALAAFGDGSLYLEKAIVDPRHVEFQILGDSHGALLHLFERDCSVQRRHQKIVEEAPSPFLDEDLRLRMGEAALAVARAVGYTNAGTVEFLVDGQRNFYFLEMNTRLQVEHPVTEAITGIDLVKWQIRIAAGARLPWSQDDLARRGHAVECRLYAEDPATAFLPSTGRIEQLVEPQGPGVRVDSGIRAGDEVTRFYDPLLAKIIVHAESREEALDRMKWALSETVLLGDVTTNLAFLQAVIDHPRFRRGEATTRFIADNLDGWQPPSTVPAAALVAAALQEVLTAQHAASSTPGGDGADPHTPWQRLHRFRIRNSQFATQELPMHQFHYTAGDETVVVQVESVGGGYQLTVGDRIYQVSVDEFNAGRLSLRLDDHPAIAYVAASGADRSIWVDGAIHRFAKLDPHSHRQPSRHRGRESGAQSSGQLTASMPGAVVAVRVATGDHVKRGAPLVILEAMKMELQITAPIDGAITAIHCQQGQSVERGQLLVEIE
jgi:3-methylcrotonyl-CoA carboxylase alpha subunit